MSIIKTFTFKDVPQPQQQQEGYLIVHHTLPKIIISMALNNLSNLKRLE